MAHWQPCETPNVRPLLGPRAASCSRRTTRSRSTRGRGRRGRRGLSAWPRPGHFRTGSGPGLWCSVAAREKEEMQKRILAPRAAQLRRWRPAARSPPRLSPGLLYAAKISYVKFPYSRHVRTPSHRPAAPGPPTTDMTTLLLAAARPAGPQPGAARPALARGGEGRLEDEGEAEVKDKRGTDGGADKGE